MWHTYNFAPLPVDKKTQSLFQMTQVIVVVAHLY
jgi:hypothetical protein